MLHAGLWRVLASGGKQQSHARALLCRVSKYGPVFKTHLYGYAGYALTDFEAFEAIFCGSHKQTEPFFPETFMELMGADGSIVSEIFKGKNAHLKIVRSNHQAA